jgi:hypothetical protein
MLRRALVAVLVAATVLGLAGGAGAHVESSGSAAVIKQASPTRVALGQKPAAEPSGPLWPVLLLVTLAPALARRRSRRVVAALLVALVGVLAFETSLHSVHHGRADERVACPTASVATHVHGATAGLLAIDAPMLRVGLLPAIPVPLVRPERPVDSQDDRAPPSALA